MAHDGGGIYLGDPGSPARHRGRGSSVGLLARKLMDDPSIRLLVLDELNIALRYDYLPLPEVLATLGQRRDDLNIVVTGRNAKPELIAIADLVTEMGMVKHHFSAGVKAQPGIEF